MTALTVRALELRARQNGRSVEAEVRRIIAQAVQEDNNWHQEVLSIAQRNGVTQENHDALAQALSEADKPIEEPAVFAK